MIPRKLSICSFGEPLSINRKKPALNIFREFFPALPLNQGSLRGSYAVEVCEFYGIAAGDVDGSTITLRCDMGASCFFWDGMLMGWWNDGWVLQGAAVQIDRVFDRVPQWTLNEKQRNSVTVQLWLSLVNMRSLWKFSRIESTMWQQKYIQDLSGIIKLDTPDFFRLMYGCDSRNFRSNCCPPLWTVSTY